MIRAKFINSIITNTFNSYTVDWINRVLKNNGSMPSYQTSSAIDTFLKKLYNSGLLYKMKSICMFAPDNLTAALCPVYKSFGYDIWLNYNFVTSDLDINGLKGNASNKYLNTGVNARSSMSTTSNGMTLYVYEAIGQTAFDMGCDGSDSGYYELTTNYYDGSLAPDTANVYCDETYGSQQAASYFTPASSFHGYHSGNRIASNNIDIYYARSVTTHVAHPSTGTHTGYSGTAAKVKPMPNVNITCFCTNRNTGTSPSYFSSKRISCSAIHDGLTFAESNIFFNLIHECRQRIGGGWK